MSAISGYAHDHALLLIAGIGGVLMFASVIGFGLKLAAGARVPHALVDNLNARVRSWWLIAAALGLAALGGDQGITALFAFVSLVALAEFLRPLRECHDQPYVLAIAFGIVLPLQYVAVWNGWFVVCIALVPLVACVVLPLAAAATPRACKPFRQCERLCWGMLLCVYGISHIPAVLMLDVPGQSNGNVYLVLYLLLVVQASDVLQYVWGKLAGRHLIAPAVSPSKTVEGTVGGIASATALGALFAPITPFGTAASAAIAFALAALGFCSGLLFSAFKRARKLKDWGTLIPGHGGMLDRVDSLCLPAPLFFWLLWLGGT